MDTLMKRRIEVAREYDVVFDRIMASPKGSTLHHSLLREERRLNEESRRLNEKIPGAWRIRAGTKVEELLDKTRKEGA